MATLGDMKARIADEMAGRTDLLVQIERAIRSAIQMHQARRWWFCDALLAGVWPTAVDQQPLTGPNGEQVLAIDGLRMLDGGDIPTSPDAPVLLLEGDIFGPILLEGTEYYANAKGYWRALRHRTLDLLENWRGMTYGQIPTDYAWFGNQLWVSPQPFRPYYYRAQVALAPLAPAADAEGGAWMNEAEDLIRHTAAAEVYATVTQDDANAARRSAQAQLAFQRLTNYRTAAPVGRLAGYYL
ncbi:hypothetical protein [Rhodovarius lipocyclicus]|uniref:hypothetical protein n=1 Tax=Rhodovarius lipocyclicus TaxID=268410 RepID=UPI00135837CF|nr:hypothetical protein [Rhodovarius lipocyclicus]